MAAYKDLTKEELLELKSGLQAQFEEVKARGLKLDMSRGKPAAAQLNLSMEMMNILNSGTDLVCEDGVDCRNYGVLDGIKEAKQLADGCPCITSINLGNTKESKTTTQISKQVFLEDEEKAILKELMNRGVECEIRALVDDSKINVAHALI